MTHRLIGWWRVAGFAAGLIVTLGIARSLPGEAPITEPGSEAIAVDAASLDDVAATDGAVGDEVSDAVGDAVGDAVDGSIDASDEPVIASDSGALPDGVVGGEPDGALPMSDAAEQDASAAPPHDPQLAPIDNRQVDPRWSPVWQPFRSLRTAQGFADYIGEATGLLLRVSPPDDDGDYEVEVSHRTDADHAAAIERIVNATGYRPVERP